MNVIAWDKESDRAIIPERAPSNNEWSLNKKTKTKRQYRVVQLKTDVEIKSLKERLWRDSEIERTDRLVMLPDYPLDLLGYRQSLRDYPSGEDFPYGARPSL